MYVILNYGFALFLCTWVMKDFSNGVATPKLGLSLNSGFVDCSPLEYDFRGLLDDGSSNEVCTDDL